MLTRFTRIQLVVFSLLTIVALLVLALYYLRIPSVAGIGQYYLKAELPASGGLYRTSNVTYRGTTIGRVTDVQPTANGVEATMRISNKYKIPIDASANVHSVTAIGEQYLDLVSANDPDEYFKNGQTITKSSVPTSIGPALDAANRGLAAIPADKIPTLLTETAMAVGDLGPSLQRLVDGTQALVGDLKVNIKDITDIVRNTGPILNSQVTSADAIGVWAANLNSISAQVVQEDAALRSGLQQAAPTAEALEVVFSGIEESLPQTLANVSILTDMLKRYNKGVEQVLVVLPQIGGIAKTTTWPAGGYAYQGIGLSINQPAPCLTGFLPASEWRSFSDTSEAPVPKGLYCKIPQETPSNSVRGARNMPCADVPGKRAPSPEECRGEEPYTPLGTNPWYGDPEQILNCPAPGARCDQPVNPGAVIPAPSVNTGLNPLASELLPPPAPIISDPLSRPGSGSVRCAGPWEPGWPQPDTCTYTPAEGEAATYNPASGEVTGPDGATYSVNNSSSTGDDGWKEMLAPAS